MDTIAEQYADAHNISKLILRPQYARYGKGAPLRRNEKMVDLADRVVIVWDGKSKGTQYTLRDAKERERKFVLLRSRRETIRKDNFIAVRRQVPPHVCGGTLLLQSVKVMVSDAEQKSAIL